MVDPFAYRRTLLRKIYSRRRQPSCKRTPIKNNSFLAAQSLRRCSRNGPANCDLRELTCGGLASCDQYCWSKVTALYNRPLPRRRSLLCLAQRSFPLCVGVVLRAPLREHGISDLEVAMRCASVANCVPGTIKLLHCGGLADWAKERPGQRSATFRNPSPC